MTAEEKLNELRAVQQKAGAALAQLDAERNKLTQMLIETQGAIKVLEELTNGDKSE